MRVLCRWTVVPLLMLQLVLAGCSDGTAPSPSNIFLTGNIYAYMRAVQDESGSVTTTVQLRDGPASTAGYIYLSAGESLYSSLDASPVQLITFESNLFGNALTFSQRLKVMAERDLYRDFFLFADVLWGKPEYFSHDKVGTGTAPTRAYVVFERAGNVMTGESSTELPTGFQILSPAAEASISRATTPAIALTWSNLDAAATMELEVAGSCADGSRYTLQRSFGGDTGAATLAGADYFPASADPAINCRVAIMLHRIRLGGVSPQFAFGSFQGVQRRTVQFTSTP